MRIISGKLQRFRFVPPKGFPSRPTTDFAKEGLFNVLTSELALDGLEILDLFAGTGNITFEFASREAGKITSVDKNFRCVQFIRQFAKKYEIDQDISVLKADVMKFVDTHSKSYDLIFADPPYEEDVHKDLVEKILESNLLKDNGLFILEHGKRQSFEEHPKFVKTKKYGNVIFSFFKHNL